MNISEKDIKNLVSRVESLADEVQELRAALAICVTPVSTIPAFDGPILVGTRLRARPDWVRYGAMERDWIEAALIEGPTFEVKAIDFEENVVCVKAESGKEMWFLPREVKSIFVQSDEGTDAPARIFGEIVPGCSVYKATQKTDVDQDDRYDVFHVSDTKHGEPPERLVWVNRALTGEPFWFPEGRFRREFVRAHEDKVIKAGS